MNIREEVAAAVKETGRSCGTCNMCCKLPPVPEINKPELVWCKHCRPGMAEGCAIYASRPQVCADFACNWLMDLGFGDEWFPQRSKIVIRGTDEGGSATLQFMVDPSVSHRWREEPYYSTIKLAAFNGINLPGKSQYRTCVQVTSTRAYLILPEKDLETHEGQIIVTFNRDGSPWGWDAKLFDTQEQAQRFCAELERAGLAAPGNAEAAA
jgi:hypothetical protein